MSEKQFFDNALAKKAAAEAGEKNDELLLESLYNRLKEISDDLGKYGARVYRGHATREPYENVLFLEMGDETNVLSCTNSFFSAYGGSSDEWWDQETGKHYEGTVSSKALGRTIEAAIQEIVDSIVVNGKLPTYTSNLKYSGGESRYEGAKSGCFIATAAYGTPLATEVNLLRRFRDGRLMRRRIGRAFVASYYRLSPPVARVIKQSRGLRAMTRVVLWPLVYLLRK
jgi:hypothetical protein